MCAMSGTVAYSAVVPPPCQTVAFSPDFVVDGTAFCYRYPPGDWQLQLYVTTNGMRTWRRMGGHGVGVGSSVLLGQLLVSPRFAADRTIYLGASNKLYMSTDLGETFTLASSVSWGLNDRSNLALYIDDTLPVVGGGATVAFADPRNDRTLRIAPPVHLPIVGTPDRDVRYLFSSTATSGAPAFALAEKDLDAGAAVYPKAVLYSCDARLECTTPMFAFPDGQWMQAGYLSPDFAKSKLMFVITRDYLHLSGTVGGDHLWRSTDGGRTFVEDRATQAMSAGVRRAKGNYIVADLTFVSDRRIIMRWAYSRQTPVPGIPAEQVRRSDDGGATWTLVARSGTGGSIPWAFSLAESHVGVHSPRPGLLVALAVDLRRHGDSSIHCSRDAGRTWRAPCS